MAKKKKLNDDDDVLPVVEEVDDFRAEAHALLDELLDIIEKANEYRETTADLPPKARKRIERLEEHVRHLDDEAKNLLALLIDYLGMSDDE